MSNGKSPEHKLLMGSMMSILEDMELQILVTDVLTDEILYANKKMNQGYNVTENVVGKKCWEVYQDGKTGRCHFCPLHSMDMDSDSSVDWEDYNTATGRWFRNKSSIMDWPDGRRVHLEQGVDVTEEKKHTEDLRLRLEEQRLTTWMTQLFLSMDNVQELISQALQKVGEYLKIDRVMLVQIKEESPCSMTFKSRWFRDKKYDLGEMAVTEVTVNDIEKRFMQDKLPYVLCGDVAGDTDFSMMAKYGITAFLSAPVFVNGQLWGTLSLEMCSGPKDMGSSEVFMARVLTNLIGGVLEREIIRDNINRAEERTKAMLDANPLACTLFDQYGNPIDCNKAAVNICGFRNKEEFMECFYDRHPRFQPDGRDSRDSFREKIGQAFRGEDIRTEWIYMLPNGAELPAEVIFTRIMWRGTYCVAGYARDLRGEKEAEAVMKEAEQRTHLMLDVTPLACTFFDMDSNLIDCNEEAPRMYGLDSKEEYIRRFYELSPEFQPDGLPSRQKAYHMFESAFRTGKEVFEWLHIRADGEIIPTEITLIRVKWKNGYRLAGYARDLRVIKAQIAQLEKTRDELREARDKAEDSARAKSTFLANMSHEIRTPMNAIIGMTDIARDSKDMERIQYCLGKVKEAANHLLGVINDVLDMSKIEAGKLDLNPSDFPLEKMLMRVSDITSFRAEYKFQNFFIKVDKDVPETIVADQQRLTQVITNLLSNAVRFTPEGGRISLLVHNMGEQDGIFTLMFEVIDTGIGITEEQKSRLFQSFEQADGSISRRFGGTGLGLAISKSIVEKMGGEIGVDSRPQEGSRFYFTIQAKKGRKSYQNKLDPHTNWKNVNILIVDDAPEVREYFEDIAASIGIRCETAADAYQALGMLEDGKEYQILFVDWMMPGMNGIELVRKIRGKYGENVVIIMISAADWSQIAPEAQEVGIRQYIGKPLLPSAIIDCMNECLGHQKQSARDDSISEEWTPFAGKRILLAEDIEINREIIITLLNKYGAQVDYAENGKIVCDMFRDGWEHYDLILMDIHMPEMDGYEATGAIRTMDVPNAMDIPIIAMTANVFREDVERCLASGMDDHLGKPVDGEVLFNTLRRYIIN